MRKLVSAGAFLFFLPGILGLAFPADKAAAAKKTAPALYSLDELVAVPWTDYDPNRPLHPGC